MKLKRSCLLEEGLSKLCLGEERINSALIRYIKEIELFNPVYGLVKVKNQDELIVKHILDSLSPVNIFLRLQCKPDTFKIADVGSGAGLPGIPLAICMPKVKFTLIERMGKRAGFLRNVTALLELPNVKVEEAEMEKLKTPECGFNLIVFRAYRPLNPIVLSNLLRLLAPGGTLAAYKGKRSSIEEEMSRLFNAGKDHAKINNKTLRWEIIPLEVPFLQGERHLVLINEPYNEPYIGGNNGY